MTDVNIFGQIRGTVRQFFAGAAVDVQPVLGDGGEQIINQQLPERAELIRLGKSFGAAIPTGSAFTYVAAWPTTRAELVVINGEASGGPSYVVDRVWMSDITTGATGGRAILGQIVAVNSSPMGATGPATADTATVLRHQLSARSQTSATNARMSVANVQFAIANQWFPLGSLASVGGVTTIGTTVEADLKGRVLIPPGAALCLAGVAGAASGTAILGIEWHEVQLNLG